jgi:hypothetical protein
MIKSKLALVVGAIAIAFASPAFAKTIRHSQNDTAAQQQLYDTAAPRSGTQLENPYYAPYYGQSSPGGSFVPGGFR